MNNNLIRIKSFLNVLFSNKKFFVLIICIKEKKVWKWILNLYSSFSYKMIGHPGVPFFPPVFLILHYLTFKISIHYILSLANTFWKQFEKMVIHFMYNFSFIDQSKQTFHSLMSLPIWRVYRTTTPQSCLGWPTMRRRRVERCRPMSWLTPL